MSFYLYGINNDILNCNFGLFTFWFQRIWSSRKLSLIIQILFLWLHTRISICITAFTSTVLEHLAIGFHVFNFNIIFLRVAYVIFLPRVVSFYMKIWKFNWTLTGTTLFLFTNVRQFISYRFSPNGVYRKLLFDINNLLAPQIIGNNFFIYALINDFFQNFYIHKLPHFKSFICN